MTITGFLIARIAEDEVVARLGSGCLTMSRPAPRVAFDGERLLAECEAKRRIVERHRSSQDTRGVGQQRNGEWTPYCEYDSESWPCPDIADVAAVYADHPDYRDEWRP